MILLWDEKFQIGFYRKTFYTCYNFNLKEIFLIIFCGEPTWRKQKRPQPNDTWWNKKRKKTLKYFQSQKGKRKLFPYSILFLLSSHESDKFFLLPSFLSSLYNQHRDDTFWASHNLVCPEKSNKNYFLPHSSRWEGKIFFHVLKRAAFIFILLLSPFALFFCCWMNKRRKEHYSNNFTAARGLFLSVSLFLCLCTIFNLWCIIV